ncbi:hypothetical protein EJB05_46012, partial [Eragrostis curvula]
MATSHSVLALLVLSALGGTELLAAAWAWWWRRARRRQPGARWRRAWWRPTGARGWRTRWRSAGAWRRLAGARWRPAGAWRRRRLQPPAVQLPTPPPYTPSPPPYTPSPPPRTCPIDTLKLNACVDVLGGLIHLVIGQEARAKCCPLLQGIADLDAALCLCTTIRARLLNLNIYLPVALTLLITCGKHAPNGFQCPPLHAAATTATMTTGHQLQLQ